MSLTPLDAALGAIAVLLGARWWILIGGALADAGRRRLRSPTRIGALPPLTVLVPAFNEERVVEATVASILASDHPALRVVVIDDGSTDNTAAVVQALDRADPRVHGLIRLGNSGKSAALNAGLAVAVDSPHVASVDADTVLAPDALRLLAEAMVREGAAAVAANVKVGNRTRWITRWQSVEYVTAMNLDRRAQAILGCITTVPGAAALFRRDAVVAAGGWSGDTRVEDTDLSLTLLAAGLDVAFEPRALAFTEAPTDWGGLLRQRVRWLFGYLQCLFKHKRLFLRADVLGVFAMPNLLYAHLLVFLLPLPALLGLTRAPAWVSWQVMLTGLAGVVAVDLVVAAWIWWLDREDARDLLHVPIQRLVWPFLLYATFVRVVWQALVHGTVPWARPIRRGALADHVTSGEPPGTLR